MTIFQGVILNGTEVINAPTIVGNTAFQTNDQTITFGQPLAAASTRLSQDTTRAQLVLGLGTALGSQLVIGANAWIGRDFDHAAPANPTLFIHSATDPDVNNTQWMSLAHDQTSAIITTGKGFLSLTGAGGAGGTVNIGSTATVVGLNAANDLIVSNRLEVINASFFDGLAGFYFGALFVNQKGIGFGAGGVTDTYVYPNAAQTQITFSFGSSHNRSMVICDSALYTKNYDHALQTNPTLFIHSATDPDVNNTQWLSLVHNQTNAVIATGLGDIILDPISEITEVCGVGLKTKEYNLTLNNGAKVNLPAGTGWGTFMIGDNQEYARIRWTAAAVVTLDEGTANVAIADTPAFFCLYDDVATVAIKNNLGVNLTLRYVIHYS
jgi:hypothetical protein